MLPAGLSADKSNSASELHTYSMESIPRANCWSLQNINVATKARSTNESNMKRDHIACGPYIHSTAGHTSRPLKEKTSHDPETI
jgi:hypothetical protein